MIGMLSSGTRFFAVHRMEVTDAPWFADVRMLLSPEAAATAREFFARMVDGTDVTLPGQNPRRVMVVNVERAPLWQSEQEMVRVWFQEAR